MSVVPNPKAIRAFANEAAFEAWLEKHHASAPELWIKIYKKASGKPTISPSQAIDVALCWGWIDAIRKPLDEEAFLQRYTPRGKKSRWSQINVERVKQLTKAKRMTAHGQRHVDAAKSDGRWDAAYPSSSSLQLPEELRRAAAKNRAARSVLDGLNRANQYALAHRYHHLKTAEGRARFIATWVEKLARGEVPHPALPKKKAKKLPT
jgi:uncharacterized protein YdeI (YjbR/CyaY-like superfamily)